MWKLGITKNLPQVQKNLLKRLYESYCSKVKRVLSGGKFFSSWKVSMSKRKFEVILKESQQNQKQKQNGIIVYFANRKQNKQKKNCKSVKQYKQITSAEVWFICNKYQ